MPQHRLRREKSKTNLVSRKNKKKTKKGTNSRFMSTDSMIGTVDLRKWVLLKRTEKKEKKQQCFKFSELPSNGYPTSVNVLLACRPHLNLTRLAYIYVCIVRLLRCLCLRSAKYAYAASHKNFSISLFGCPQPK